MKRVVASSSYMYTIGEKYTHKKVVWLSGVL